jgi:hypothetical protein
VNPRSPVATEPRAGPRKREEFIGDVSFDPGEMPLKEAGS